MCGKPGDIAYQVEVYQPALDDWPEVRQRAVLVLCREHDPLARPFPALAEDTAELSEVD